MLPAAECPAHRSHMDEDSCGIVLYWPDRFTHSDGDYNKLLDKIKREEALQHQWELYYRSMDQWFAEEQARCAMPTVADVAEHWSYNDLKHTINSRP